ncbi:hypothetical protein [Ramlibacter sp.]|uniref:hypothetical protein n=1 Tax=Ramlibacter sp. TaxID=1917967 RepID=UPI0017C8E6DF|nr:hypothetical protein [Ramlibacter sp.]MBA2676105.1 hypothetical protein [Ramlibacter sp.]
MHPLLVEGLTDAAGFVGGVLLAWGLGSLLGLDPLAPGYGNSAMGGILLAGLGGGLGLHMARRWRRGRASSITKD